MPGTVEFRVVKRLLIALAISAGACAQKTVPLPNQSATRFEEYANKNPQSGRAWYNVGYASLAAERPEVAAEAFQKALDLGYRKPATMYNLACAYAHLGQKDAAFDWLFKAIDAGYDEASQMRRDEDLDNLRGDPRYRQAIEIARAHERGGEDD